MDFIFSSTLKSSVAFYIKLYAIATSSEYDFYTSFINQKVLINFNTN